MKSWLTRSYTATGGAGSLDEHNSPTYDGIALYGLHLWRDEPPTPVFADLGDQLATAVWRDIGARYHAGLRNLVGPYSRAYGMDLRSYANVVGLWIWAAVGAERAPFPDLATPFDHAADACFGPMVGLFDGAVPDDVRARLLAFPGPHEVGAGVPGEWSATSWLTEDVMAGAHAGSPVSMGGHQIVPVTVHWAGGWIRVRNRHGGVDAEAMPGRIEGTVHGPGPAVLTVGVLGLDPATLATERWWLPGLDVTLWTAGENGPPRVTANGVALGLPRGPFRLDVEPA